MSHPARIRLAVPQPEEALVVEVVPDDGRLVTGLEAGPTADSTQLSDDLWRFADQSQGPVVINMRGVNWIDSGAVQSSSDSGRTCVVAAGRSCFA